MNFKFENLIYDPTKTFQQNLYSTGFKNLSSLPQFRTSQVVESIFVFNHETQSDEQLKIYDAANTIPSHYIISTAVGYSPYEWTSRNNAHTSPFNFLNNQYLRDLQSGNAILLVDQSVEGYHAEWLWEWFHNECLTHNISPSAIIYCTGNQLAADQYINWYRKSDLTCDRLKVIPSTSLSMYIYQTYMRTKMSISFDDILKYKTTNNISLYNCTNLRLREHRILNFLHLVNAGLISAGKISMGDKTQWPAISNYQLTQYKLPTDILDKVGDITPMWIDGIDPNTSGQYHQYITRILDKLYADTWVSLVVESSFFDYEHSVFISEKTFKPIACMQPFIIVGSKHSLKYLRKLGYKTFNGFIDESYDDLDDADRFVAITNALKQIQQIPDKISWLIEMREILEHNHRVFLKIGSEQSIEHCEISKYYSNYFKK